MPTTHIVRRGECLSSIARLYGFASYKSIYDDSANADFRKTRPNPNVIYAGDEIVIPDKTPKQESRAAEDTHTFKVKLAKRKLVLVLQDLNGTAMADTAYKLLIGDLVINDKTGGDGKIDKDIPATAISATLVVGIMRRALLIGELNPMKNTKDEGITGVQARLKNLGYNPGKIDGLNGRRTRAAIIAFQTAQGKKDPDGVINDELIAQLEKEHGS